MKIKLLFLLTAICLQKSDMKGNNGDVSDIAKQYPIELNKPAVDFFEGALLGNGGMGVVVSTRPDAVQLHLTVQ